MAKKAAAARKRTSKTSGKLKSTILARIRKEADRGRGRGGPRDYYAKDAQTKPGGGYAKGDFIKSDERGGRKKTTRKTTRKSTKTQKTKRTATKR
jgi:hypothetical protein